MISFTYPENVAVNWNDEYIEEKLQDEMFRDADELQDQDDEMEFQFRSPDLFSM